jgi:hypothetical protein
MRKVIKCFIEYTLSRVELYTPCSVQSTLSCSIVSLDISKRLSCAINSIKGLCDLCDNDFIDVSTT